MRIEVIKPNPDFPLAYLHVDLFTNTDREDFSDILAKNRLTLLGRWEPHHIGGVAQGLKAPVLLEDEHVKPRRVSTKKTTKGKA